MSFDEIPDPSAALNGLLIGLLSSLGSAVIIALVFLAIYFFRCTTSGRILLDRIGRPGEYDDEQAFLREESEALETMDELQRVEYLRAKAFVAANPPESIQTDISLSQYLAIQEKGVSAWEFEPELEIANCFVEARTEIEFFDSECTVMCNLPVPKQNEVYYWEAKIFDKPENTLISIGMATKPYPLFRLPGFHKHSVAYLSNGARRHNQPFNGTPYAPPYVQGDVIGVGYRPRTGTIFYTRNGKRLEDVAHGLKMHNFFPAVGANGPAVVHVNLGQAGFVFVEAQVKKWGLAPMTGSLAPPPPYGSEQGSILLETGTKDGFASASPRGHRQSLSLGNGQGQGQGQAVHTYTLEPGHGRSRSGTFRVLPPTSPGPIRSPTDISLAQLVPTDEVGESSSNIVIEGAAVSMDSRSSSHSGSSSGTHSGPSAAVGNRSSGQNESATVVGLGLSLQHPNSPPPPQYSSPPHSDNGDSRRNSTDSDEDRPLILGRRSRGASLATVVRGHPQGSIPPIPSYNDAVRQGAGRDRSQSARSARSARSSR